MREAILCLTSKQFFFKRPGPWGYAHWWRKSPPASSLVQLPVDIHVLITKYHSVVHAHMCRSGVTPCSRNEWRRACGVDSYSSTSGGR